jgi:phosphoribosyl 1,2-cyclic phosphate phosphodiesterase
LIDEELKIDFCPDTVSQMQRSGRNLARVRTILFTHQHSDHLAARELEWAIKPFTQTPPPGRLEVCGNSAALGFVRDAFREVPRMAEAFELRETKAGDHFTTTAGDEVWVMPADHCDGATVLRIRRGGRTTFYGHDSGKYPVPTMERLCDGIPLDIALFDCTNGGIKTQNRGHMGVDGVTEAVAELRRRGAIVDGTRVIATHFSHNGGLMHEDLVRTFMPLGIEVAFDGMVVRA